MLVETHMIRLCNSIRDSIISYLEENNDADVNDVLSSLAYLLVVYCRDFDVSRTEVLGHVNQMYEVTRRFDS